MFQISCSDIGDDIYSEKALSIAMMMHAPWDREGWGGESMKLNQRKYLRK